MELRNKTVDIENARGQLIAVTNQIMGALNLSPIDMEGVLFSVLSQVQSQTQLEIVGFMLEREQAMEAAKESQEKGK